MVWQWVWLCTNNMASSLNLLPQDLQVSKGLGKVLKVIKSIGVISVVMFSVFLVVIVALFVVSKVSLNGLQNSNDKLKAQVKAQETSEQQLVLLKDRLSKISSVRALPNATNNIQSISSVIGNVSTLSSIDSANVSLSKIDLSLNILSNEDLTIIMDNLRNSEKFNLVDLYSFDYSQGLGYSIKATLSKK